MVSSRDGADGVWRMNVDGSDQRLLAHVPAAAWLSITPDGRRVICTSYSTGQPSIWSVPIDGGQAVEIGRDLERASVSPDGKWLGGFYEPAGNVENSRPAAAVVPLDGSAPHPGARHTDHRQRYRAPHVERGTAHASLRRRTSGSTSGRTNWTAASRAS